MKYEELDRASISSCSPWVRGKITFLGELSTTRMTPKKTFSNIFSTEGDAQKCRGIVHQVCRDGDHHLGPLQDGRHPPGHHQDRGCQQSSGRYVR